MYIENNDLYFTLRTVIITVCTVAMMCSITDFKYSAKKITGFYLLFALYTLGITGVLVHFFGYLILLRMGLLVISLPGILLTYFLAKDQPAKAVFNYTSQILFSAYCCLSLLLINTRLWNSAFIDLPLTLASYSLIILFEYRFVRPRFLRLSATVEQGWGILSLIPCSLLVLVFTIAYYPVHLGSNPTGVVLFYLLAAVTAVIYFTIFQYLSLQYRSQLASHNMELLALQVSNLKERLSENEASAEAARIERHDARHHFQTISSLLEQEDTQAALTYIHTSLAQLHEPDQTRYCSNPVLNAVLSSYLGQAKREHIRLETHLSIPDSLPVDATELSIVCANALENAIHACLSLPEEDRRIVLTCIHQPSLMLEISNPYAGTIPFSGDGFPVAATSGHGIGTRSIAAFCKKHDALYSFHGENGWFTVKVVL